MLTVGELLIGLLGSLGGTLILCYIMGKVASSKTFVMFTYFIICEALFIYKIGEVFKRDVVVIGYKLACKGDIVTIEYKPFRFVVLNLIQSLLNLI